MMKLKLMTVATLLLAVLFAGCLDGGSDVTPTPTPEPTQAPQPTPMLTPTATPTPEPTQIPTPAENVTLRPPKPIYLDKYSLTPKTPTIRAGEALNWINMQRSPMIDFVLVSEDGLWDNKTIIYGKKFKYTFSTPGNYTYYCPGYGTSMRGTVTVI